MLQRVKSCPWEGEIFLSMKKVGCPISGKRRDTPIFCRGKKSRSMRSLIKIEEIV